MNTKHVPILIVLGFTLIGFLPRTEAVSPTPDGCYPNFTTAEGCAALNSLTSGSGNTGLGWEALFSNTDGSFNTGVGAGAVIFNNGSSNTAVGAAALLLNSVGAENTALGTDAMVFNDSGNRNTSVGAFTLFSNTQGFQNSAVGWGALTSNINGNYNNAFGVSALSSNDGSFNNAFGSNALNSNTIGAFNNAVGESALLVNTTGNYNCAFGAYALHENIDSSYNNGFGLNALYSAIGFGNNGFGSSALMFVGQGIENTAIGDFAGNNVNGDYNICVGAGVTGNSGENNTIHIGDNLPDDPGASACFIGGINGQTSASGIAVLIDATGKLGTLTSSSRFKKDIKPIDDASEGLFSLHPVTFHYNKDLDPKSVTQFGLVAEDVEKVNPDLVAYDQRGKPYSVRYEAVNAMLLNEFLKEHKAFVEEQHKVEKLQATLASLVATVKEQATQIQKVSEQFETTKSGSQVAANGQ